MVTGRQLRAARAYLDWTLDDLAGKADVSRGVIWQIEKNAGLAKAETVEKLVQTLAKHGITIQRGGEMRGIVP